MSDINGGPAFPRTGFYGREGVTDHDTVPQDGMTLRDYFSANAMPTCQAMMAGEDDYFTSATVGTIAAMCYAMADAMLKEREK